MTEMIVTSIPLDQIHYDDTFNCRGPITPLDVVDLAKDIDKRGLIQPVVIRPYSDTEISKTGKKYLLIAGYRRYMAHRVLKKETIDAAVREDMEDELDARLFNLSENLQRKELNIYQEAKAIEKLHLLGLGEHEAAEKLTKSRGWVQIRFMVLKLPEEIQQEIAAGFFNQPQIRDLHSHFIKKGKNAAFSVAREFKDDKIKGRKGTRRKVETDKPNIKRHRSRSEIFDKQDKIREAYGNSIVTRVLAWCAGEITTEDFDAAVKEHHG